MTQALPLLLVTRPNGQARALADRFNRHAEVIISPLISVVPLAAKPDYTNVSGLIVTSANAARIATGAGLPLELPMYVVGNRTADVLRSAGNDVQLVAQDADHLVSELIGSRVDGPLVHVHGAYTRGNIAQRLSHSGIKTEGVCIYTQDLQPLTEAAQTVLNGERRVIVPLYSPRTAGQFVRENTGHAPLEIIAMSQAVADELPQRPDWNVTVLEAPDGNTMENTIAGRIDAVALIESAAGAH